jgi:hypothetical protein
MTIARKYFGVFSFGLAAWLCAGCSTNSTLKNLTVPEKFFLTITNGSSLDAVRNAMGLAARHEFTISENTANYTLIKCSVSPDNKNDDVTSFDLLFCNNLLIKIIDVPWFGRARPLNIKNNPELIRNTISTQALAQAEILNKLRPYHDKEGSIGMMGGVFITSCAVLLAPVTWAFMLENLMDSKGEYKANNELVKQYDGCRASLGMSAAEVDALYGKPLRILSMKNGEIARVYGDNQDLDDVEPWLRFSCVAVVFNSQENVKAIYSDDFFEDEWKK